MRAALPLLLSALAAAAWSGEAGPLLVESVPFTLESGSGFVPLRPGEPGRLADGVALAYGGVALQGNRLEWLLTPFGSAGRPVLERLALQPGEPGWSVERVRLDSRTASLPAVGFRGLLTPTGLVATRLPADPAAPTQVRWRVVASDPGWWSGELRGRDGWLPHGGWAHEIELVIAADLDGDQPRRLRFVSIHLFGRNAEDPAARRLARLDRLRAPLARAEDLAALPETAIEGGLEGLTISIEFDDAGRLEAIRPEGMMRIRGALPQDVPMRMRSRVEGR